MKMASRRTLSRSGNYFKIGNKRHKNSVSKINAHHCLFLAILKFS
jgi:hypothetical protein